MTTLNQVEAAATACTLPTRDGAVCGRPGQVGLPAGICSEHAVRVFRAVSKLVEVQRTQEASR